MTTQYNVSKYTNGINGYSARFTDTNETVILTASTDTTVTVPSDTSMGMFGQTHNKFLAQFTYTAAKDVWVALNATAAVPTGSGSFASSTSCLNPNARLVNAGDVIHFYTTASNTAVGVEFYSLQE